METWLQGVMDPFFLAFNAGEEAVPQSLCTPEMVFFGSLIPTPRQRPGSIQGVFKGLRDGAGLRRLVPQRCFGNAPEVATLALFQTEEGSLSVEGVLVF